MYDVIYSSILRRESDYQIKLLARDSGEKMPTHIISSIIFKTTIRLILTALVGLRSHTIKPKT